MGDTCACNIFVQGFNKFFKNKNLNPFTCNFSYESYVLDSLFLSVYDE